jgi:hypothetical protein
MSTEPGRIAQILDELNDYGAGRRDAKGADIWGDLIEQLPEYDQEATDALHDTLELSDRTAFVLDGGAVVDWDPEAAQWVLADEVASRG